MFNKKFSLFFCSEKLYYPKIHRHNFRKKIDISVCSIIINYTLSLFVNSLLYYFYYFRILFEKVIKNEENQWRKTKLMTELKETLPKIYIFPYMYIC